MAVNRTSLQPNTVSVVTARVSRLLRLWENVSRPAQVLSLLSLGLLLGLNFPHSSWVRAAYRSGTWFPRLIVTLAALLVFHLLAAAMAKLILLHKGRAGLLFVRIVSLYLAMGVASLLYALVWVPLLAHLPASLPGAMPLGPLEWVRQIGGTISHVLSQQPLLQALLGACWQDGWRRHFRRSIAWRLASLLGVT